MCGICGWIDSSGIEMRRLVEMNRLAAHRGPDGEGYWLNDPASEGGCFLSPEEALKTDSRAGLGFGHQRLAILDLSENGIQPMAAKDRQVWLVFNGEIYNYLELRSELVALGHCFKTGTDTEVILAAYQAWGTDCFARFNGMWGLVLADLKARKLVFSRDRLGIKPLYLWVGDQALAFASEIKQLFALPGIEPEANIDAVVEYIDTGYESPPATFFNGIQAFPPGCWGEVSLEDLRMPKSQPFWFPEEVATVTGTPRCEDVLERTRTLFEDAVRLRMRSDVPVGACLSGGLDSSAIFCQMKKLQEGKHRDIFAFSAAYDDASFDERKFVELVIQATGGEVHYTYTNAEDFLVDFDRFIFQHDEPPGSFSMYAAWDVMRLARKNQVPVLLNGQGGDELFSGYWHAYYLFLKQTKSPWVLIHHLLGSVMPGGNAQLAWQLFPHLHRYRHRRGRKNRDIILQKWHQKGFTQQDNWATRAQDLSPRQYRIEEIRKIHLPRLLKWEDRNSMAYSIEGRYPFLDHRMLEWAISLPPEWNFRRGWNKLVLRESFSSLLPAEIQWRKTKLGFVTPQSQWIQSTLGDPIRACLEDLCDQLKEILDLNMLEDWAAATLEARSIPVMDERHRTLIRIFFLDRWFKTFNVGLGHV